MIVASETMPTEPIPLKFICIVVLNAAVVVPTALFHIFFYSCGPKKKKNERLKPRFKSFFGGGKTHCL